MKLLDDLPLYIVFAAVLLNLIVGIKMNIGFSALMIRSMIVTIVFSAFGYVLSRLLKNICHENRQKNAGNADMKREPTINIQIPPMDDEALSNLGQQEDDDEFTEINPAYLHSYRQKEKE